MIVKNDRQLPKMIGYWQHNVRITVRRHCQTSTYVIKIHPQFDVLCVCKVTGNSTQSSQSYSSVGDSWP